MHTYANLPSEMLLFTRERANHDQAHEYWYKDQILFGVQGLSHLGFFKLSTI